MTLRSIPWAKKARRSSSGEPGQLADHRPQMAEPLARRARGSPRPRRRRRRGAAPAAGRARPAAPGRRSPMAAMASTPDRPCGGAAEGRLDAGVHEPHGGDEQLPLGAEQAEQIGLGDPGPHRDGVGRGPGVPALGELGHGRPQDRRPALVGGLSHRSRASGRCRRHHPAKLVVTHFLSTGRAGSRTELPEGIGHDHLHARRRDRPGPAARRSGR